MSNLPAVREFSKDEMSLITTTIAKGATPEELKLFLYRCQHLGLDPLKPGQIYFIKYGNSPGTIVVGIEGFRAKAQATGKCSGVSRGVVRDDKGKCIGAWCEVHRKDWTHPAREEVSLSEYNTGKAQWAKMPETMIKKVAEAAALRMAFPDDLGGVYVREEMEQAERDVTTAQLPQGSVVTSQAEPKEENGRNPRTIVITFGKYKKHETIGKAIDAEGLPAIQAYANYLLSTAGSRDQLTPGVKLFYDSVQRISNPITAEDAGLTEEQEAKVEQLINEERLRNSGMGVLSGQIDEADLRW